MSQTETVIKANLERIRARIDAACRRAGRDPADVRLVAVTKSAEIAGIRALVALGVHDLGESRPQQLVDRAPQIDAPVRWHFIGPLQRNKVQKVLPIAACLHSVDSQLLLARMSQVSGKLALRPQVLLEVNVSGEGAKQGFEPAELLANWPLLASTPDIQITGLMTMAPLSDSADAARPIFARLRCLRDELVARLPQSPLPELSMGMSGDFEAGVLEGATMVRVGTSLFEGLPTQNRAD